MSHTFRSLKLTVLLTLVVSLVFARPLFAQTNANNKTETQPTVTEKAIPLAVLCAAGVERWLNNVDYLFSTVQRDELSDFVGGQMSKLNDLKGLDKDKPFGMLIFLKPGLLPQPYPVSFVPVKNLSDLIGTAGSGPFKVKKIDDTYYDLVNDNTTLHAKLQGDYAWISEHADQLEYEFPNVLELTKRITDRYDAAFEFNLTAVPEGMKHIFLDFLRASTETSMQQRDGEPDTGYQLRRVNALNTLDSFEQMILQGERLTLGLAVDSKSKRASLEADVVAKPDSEFSKSLLDVAARPSYFANVLRDDVPLTFSMSWMLPPAHQKRLAEFFDTAEQDVASQLTNTLSGAKSEEPKTPAPAEAVPATSSGKPKRGSSGKLKKPKIPVPPAIKDIFDSLRATASTGHVDFFVQFVTDGSKDKSQFTFIGGAKLADGSKLASGVTELLHQVEGKVKLAALDFNIDSHQEIKFHRLLGSQIGQGEERMYGEKPSLYVGLGSQAVWFAIGQADALAQLKLAIDKVQPGVSERPTALTNTPVQFTMRMNRWVELGKRAWEDSQVQREKAELSAAEAAGAKGANAENSDPGRKNQTREPGGNRPGRSGNQPGRGQSPGERFMDMQQKAFSGSDDSIHIHFKPTEQGARVRFEFDEGFIRLLGFGVSMGIDSQNERQRQRQQPKDTKPKP